MWWGVGPEGAQRRLPSFHRRILRWRDGGEAWASIGSPVATEAVWWHWPCYLDPRSPADLSGIKGVLCKATATACMDAVCWAPSARGRTFAAATGSYCHSHSRYFCWLDWSRSSTTATGDTLGVHSAAEMHHAGSGQPPHPVQPHSLVHGRHEVSVAKVQLARILLEY